MIVSVPNLVLTTPAKKVKRVDKKILSIIREMKKILLQTANPKGVGLASPQIGIPLAIFITRPKENSNIDVFINPKITWQSSQVSEIIREEDGKPSLRKEKKLEGCLSIPNIWGHLKRPTKVKLRYMDIQGKIQEKEFEGFMATIVQHETDHLNGTLFTQRVLQQKEKLYRIEEDEKGEEKLVEIEI
ncbi:peptide deformylase [Candidatus Gottesmanbacteria bacterium]|nr:peptide deformylase [Candidatus Gottesmanbacteria bacterium]